MVEATHPQYEDERNINRLYRETVDGTGGYRPYVHEVKITDSWPTDENAGSMQIDTHERTYLYRHPRERAKFHRRRMMAYHIGVCRKALKMIVGFLTKQDASYTKYPSTLKNWMESGVNKRKATWRLLKNTDLVPMTLYYGELPVLLHFPPNDAVTRQQQIEMGTDLVAQPISPECILDWNRNDEGGYHWLKYVEPMDITPTPLTKGHVKIKRYHYLTQEGWWYVDEVPGSDKEWPVVASGTWDGMPLVVWNIASTGTSLIHHAAQMERELHNVTSLLQEVEREMTFPQIVMPDPGESERAMVRAVDAILWADDDSKWQPFVLSPDVKATEHLMSRETDLKGRILEEFGLEFSEGATTGVAQSFKMSKIVRLLGDLAGDLEESEYLTHAKAAEMLGDKLPASSRATWPTEFDARDIEREVDALMTVLTGPAIGNTATIRLRKRLVTAVDTNIPEDIMDDIDKEITSEVEADSNGDTDPEGTAALDDAEQNLMQPDNPQDDGAR
jgi:hypothetical protein